MKNFSFEKDGDVGILTVNRPEVLNALNSTMLEELALFLTMRTSKMDLNALILTGKGERAFIAGADVKEMNDLSAIEIKGFLQVGQQVTQMLENAPFLTMAAVNGYALGGGLEMALSCDFIYASENAKLGLPEIKLGVIPGFGGTQRLAYAVGARRAKEMIYTGKHISAQEALQIGLVNRVCTQAELLDECVKTAKEILRNPQTAFKSAKDAIDGGYLQDLAVGLILEKNLFVSCFKTVEREEAMRTFLDRVGN